MPMPTDQEIDRECNIKRQGLAARIAKRKVMEANITALKKLEREARIALIDKKTADLKEMLASTDHPKLKAILSKALAKIGEARERIE
jgi:hypothetical protein